ISLKHPNLSKLLTQARKERLRHGGTQMQAGSSQPLAPPPTLPVPATQPQQSGNFQSTPNDDSGSVCQQPPTAGVICPVCNRQLINEQALRSHFSTHPVEANNA